MWRENQPDSEGQINEGMTTPQYSTFIFYGRDTKFEWHPYWGLGSHWQKWKQPQDRLGVCLGILSVFPIYVDCTTLYCTGICIVFLKLHIYEY